MKYISNFSNSSSKQLVLPISLINFLAQMISYTGAYALPVLILIGVIGNISIIFIFNTKGGKKATSESLRIYYIYVAIGDLIRILFYPFILWLGDGFNFATSGDFSLYLDEISDITCVLTSFIYLCAATFSNWLVICLCFERNLALYFPLSIRQYATKRRAKILTLIIFIISITSSIPTFFAVRLIRVDKY